MKPAYKFKVEVQLDRLSRGCTRRDLSACFYFDTGSYGNEEYGNFPDDHDIADMGEAVDMVLDALNDAREIVATDLWSVKAFREAVGGS